MDFPGQKNYFKTTLISSSSSSNQFLFFLDKVHLIDWEITGKKIDNETSYFTNFPLNSKPRAIQVCNLLEKKTISMVILIKINSSYRCCHLKIYRKKVPF